MLGRLLTAKLSTKIDKNKLIFSYCIATAAFFILLLATHNLAVITVAIAGLGFFFAGIYPTSVSSAGAVLKGSNTGMSMFLAIGMTAAILVLLFNAAGMFVLSLVNLKVNSKSRLF